MEKMKRRIAIIGGGLRGLTAAYEIDKAIREQNLPFEYVILEDRASVGGMIHTIDMDGYAIDVGAIGFRFETGGYFRVSAGIGLGR